MSSSELVPTTSLSDSTSLADVEASSVPKLRVTGTNAPGRADWLIAADALARFRHEVNVALQACTAPVSVTDRSVRKSSTAAQITSDDGPTTSRDPAVVDHRWWRRSSVSPRPEPRSRV